MAVPQYNKMYKPFLEALKDGKPHSKQEIKEEIAVKMRISLEDRKRTIKSGTFSYDHRVSWATTYLKKAGLIEKSGKATYVITERGKEVVKENPQVLDNNYLMKYEEFRAFVRPAKENSKGDVTINTEETPDDAIQNALRQINMKLEDELMSKIVDLSPFAFERMVVDFFSKKMGYGTYEDSGFTTHRSNDDGIDGIIKKDKLGMELIYIQAKKWETNRTVGSPEIQRFIGAIANMDGKGLFVTTAKFSEKAVLCAKQNHIILVDGESLVKLMREHNFGVTIRDTFEIKTLDSDIFEEYSEMN
jgi:restriction system protein